MLDSLTVDSFIGRGIDFEPIICKIVFYYIYNIYIIYIIKFLFEDLYVLMRKLSIVNCQRQISHFQACFETCLFWRFICKVREFFVPLQCQMREVETPPIKDKNCED